MTAETVTRTDCMGVCGYAKTDEVFAAYQSGDIKALGESAKAEIERSAAMRIKYSKDVKESLRAEILAELNP